MNSIFPYKSALIAALMLTSGSTLSAQELRLSLSECISRAIEHNPSTKAAQLEAQKAQEQRSAAYAMDPTDISLSQDPTAGGSPDNAITVSQSFDFPTVYAARHRYLTALADAEASKARLKSVETERDVALAYYNLVYRQTVCRIYEQQDSVYAHFIKIARARQKAGSSSSLELINAQRTVDESAIKIRQAHAECLLAMKELQSLVATDSIILPTDTTLTALSIAAPPSTLSFEQTAVGNSYAAQAEAYQQNVRLARQAFLPRISIGLRAQCLIKSFNPYNISRDPFEKGNFMGFEVGLSVPLFWGGTRNKLKSAQRDMEIHSLMQHSASIAMAQTYSRAMSNYQQAELNLDYYEQTGLQQAQRMAHLSSLAYDAGEIDYIEYIGNQTASLSTLLAHAEAIAKYNEATIQLKYLLNE